MKVKYKIWQETAWVAEKKGQATGYGENPELAILDSQAKTIANKNQKNRLKNLESAVEKMTISMLVEENKAEIARQQSISTIQNQQKIIDKLKLEAKELKRISFDELQDRDSWVLLCMAIFKTNGPGLSCEQMLKMTGSKITDEDKAAIKRVESLVTEWRTKLNTYY